MARLQDDQEAVAVASISRWMDVELCGVRRCAVFLSPEETSCLGC